MTVLATGDKTNGFDSGKAYARDLFVTMFEKDPMNREMGLKYRKLILEPGGGKEGMEMMTEFLGREPNSKARAKELGMVE